MGIPLSEQVRNQVVERDAERYARRYSSYVNLLESQSLLSKIRPVTTFDIYALGKQLESWENYKSICEEDGTLANLGRLPDVAFDVITVNYGTSPVSAIASVQPIDEARGLIYFKNIVAQNTRGNVTAGQRIASATSMEQVSPIGYASDSVTKSAGVTVAGTLSYSFNLDYFPVRPGSVKISIPTMPNLESYDGGKGAILGYGIQGTINYNNGACVLTFSSDPGAGNNIGVTYATDFEASTDIPKILFKIDTKMIEADVYALKDTIGLEQAYALHRRFGMIAEEEVANDLVAAINSEIVNRLVTKINLNAMGNTNWSRTPTTGVAYIDHKQSFKDSLAESESVILGNAGRGTVNVMIAGRSACSIIGTLPGFVKISDGTTIGPHIFGTLDGATVIRIPNASVLDQNTILCFYNGTSPFESAAVYAPYMPLVVTNSLPTGVNPLMHQKAAAIWAATEVLVPQFITKITITS